MRTNLIKQKEEVVKPKAENSSIPKTIHIIHILDGSGSMRGSKFEAAKKGMEEEINSILNETDGIKYSFTVVEFDSNERIKTVCSKIDINKHSIDEVDKGLFNPYGNTALYDAIGYTLSEFRVDNTSDKVLVKIFTDGGENNSKTWNQKTVSELISMKESEGWVITFVGTKYDVDTITARLKIKAGNTLSYDGTGRGLSEAYSKSNIARGVYAKAVLDGVDDNNNFYKQ